MTNQEVYHSRYGKGIILKQETKHITVNFEGERVKTFVYPDAFEQFLQFTEPELQQKATQDLQIVLEKRMIDAGMKHMEYERQMQERFRIQEEMLLKKERALRGKLLREKKARQKAISVVKERQKV